MSRIRYDGPGHRLLAFGQTVLRGQSAEFTEQETRNLLAQPAIRVTVEADLAAELPPLKFGGLVQPLGPAVLEHPAPPSGEGAPEALQGEGQHTYPDEKEN